MNNNIEQNEYSGQPQSRGLDNYGPAPKTWLAESIIVTFLCCQIFGVIAIIYSSQVESKHRMGDVYGAIDASRKAKNWVIASVIVGVVLILTFFMFGIFAIIIENVS